MKPVLRNESQSPHSSRLFRPDARARHISQQTDVNRGQSIDLPAKNTFLILWAVSVFLILCAGSVAWKSRSNSFQAYAQVRLGGDNTAEDGVHVLLIILPEDARNVLEPGSAIQYSMEDGRNGRIVIDTVGTADDLADEFLALDNASTAPQGVRADSVVAVTRPLRSESMKASRDAIGRFRSFPIEVQLESDGISLVSLVTR